VSSQVGPNGVGFLEIVYYSVRVSTQTSATLSKAFTASTRLLVDRRDGLVGSSHSMSTTGGSARAGGSVRLSTG